MFVLDLGGGLRLERLETRHAAPLYEVIRRHRRYLSRFQAWPKYARTAETFRAYVHRLRDADARDESVSCGIWLDDVPAGMVALDEVNVQNLNANVWGWVAPDVKGRGVGTRSVAAVFRYGFEALALERITLRCATGNAGSRRIAEHLGMVHEGTLRSAELHGDRFHDIEVHAMLASEWAARGRRKKARK